MTSHPPLLVLTPRWVQGRRWTLCDPQHPDWKNLGWGVAWAWNVSLQKYFPLGLLWCLLSLRTEKAPSKAKRECVTNGPCTTFNNNMQNTIELKSFSGGDNHLLKCLVEPLFMISWACNHGPNFWYRNQSFCLNLNERHFCVFCWASLLLGNKIIKSKTSVLGDYFHI